MRKYLKVFVYGALIDIFYVVWIKSVALGNQWIAGLAAVLLATPSLFGYLEITKNKKLAIPYLLGLFVGTFLATLLSS